MTRFLIEVPHEAERVACTLVVRVLLTTGSHFLTSICVLESIFEKLFCLRGHSIKKSIARIAIELDLIITTIEALSVQYTRFSNLLRFFWWVKFPIYPTLYIPAIVVSWATVVNVCVIAYGIFNAVRKTHAIKRIEFGVNTGVS